MHAPADCDLEFTGELIEPAEARMLQLDTEGHVVPALCMRLQLEGGVRAVLAARQHFPAGAMDQCEAAAHRLKRGTRMRLQVPLTTIELRAVISHTHVLHEDEAAVPAEVDTA